MGKNGNCEVISPQHCVTPETYDREATPERNEMNCETKHPPDTIDLGNRNLDPGDLGKNQRIYVSFL